MLLRREDLPVMKFAYNHINEFKRLTSLSFTKMDCQDVMKIKTFLNGLQNLQRLSLTYSFITVNRCPKSRNKMIEWLQENIQKKNENLTKLTLTSEFKLKFYQFMLECTMLKYPNITAMTLNDLLIRDRFHCMHAATIHIPTIKLENCSGKLPKHFESVYQINEKH